ncbi:ATP-binding protein [Sulfurimonas sp.]|uniref:ATP-binding protein n=1 Tax=Sulfurimonas sp. TaxID=2022749 RepID=UPI0039E22106
MLVFITISKVKQVESIDIKLQNLRIPTVLHSTAMMNGINGSLAALRAWIILDDEKFKKDRVRSWDEEIAPTLLNMKQLSKNWTNPENIKRLQEITLLLETFSIYQEQVEKNLHQKEMANILLKTKAAPTASKIKEILSLMIDNQKQLMNNDIINLNDIMSSLKIFLWNGLILITIITVLISIFMIRKIDRKLTNFRNGLLDFFSYLNKEKSTTTVLNDIGNDEIDTISKIVNDNIQNTSRLLTGHEEIFTQLQEHKKALDEHAIVLITDVNGEIIYVNNNMLSISGYSREELLGENPRILKSKVHDKSFWKNMFQNIKNKETWHSEVCNKAKDGSIYWVDTTIVPILDKNSNIKNYIAIRSDITQRKKYESELIQAKEKAEFSTNAKSEFLANMSHEIRTPMNAIMGFIGILKKEETDTKKLQYLETIDSSSKSLTNIINDILDFTKIESGRLAIEYIDFNPQVELKSIEDLFKVKCEEKSINLSIKLRELPIFLNGDILRLKQVLNNLLSNAIKFTQSNKKITLDVSYDNNHLFVSVKDEGIGISEEYQEKIFESFSQADNSTTRKYGGTGLGLSISYNLIQLMGGELKVRSNLDSGSEFYFSLPLKTGKVIENRISTKKDIDFTHRKLLLVEDNKPNQLFMKVILKKMSINFNIANDGLEAIEAFKNNKYDVILMDENMPNMNGVEATKNILGIEKEQGLKHTPIIALTANALKGDREKFLEAGMDEYLTKPIDKNMLSEMLDKVLI